VLLDALVGEAEIQAWEGAIESAVEILMAVSQNPSISLATKTRAEQLRSDLMSRMPTQRVKTIKAKSDHKSIEVMVEDILTAAKASS
jgi:preprotein translocase subunit SecD